MKPRDRQRQIADLVQQRGEATVDDLCTVFSVSAETIRRDLSQLAEAGAIQKIHGAGRRIKFQGEGSFTERVLDQAPAKVEIATKLAKLVHPGQTVFMDTGSTTLAAAGALAKIPGLTVITNSVFVAQAIGHPDVLLLGGRFRGDNMQTVGPETIVQIAQFRADAAILTVTAIDDAGVAMDADLDEAQIARAMRSSARRCIIVAHNSKFGTSAPYRVCPPDDMDVLVCDTMPAPALLSVLTEAGVTVC